MPTYGYECKSCKFTFDAFQNIKDDPLKTCPECGKEVRRLINGGTGVIFKGGGFYVTDKSKAPSQKGNGAPKESSAPKEANAKEGSAACQGCPNSDKSGAAQTACPKAVNS